MMRDWRPHDIGGHALISDGQTAALIYEDATIDWLCMPRFDSQACLASLLGTGENGGWWIGPTDAAIRTSRSYRENTMILETVIETEGGEVAIIDFMPTQRGEAPDVVRIIEGRRGAVELQTRLALRFDNGRTHPMVRNNDDGGLLAIAGPNAVVLRFCCCIEHRDRAFTGKFTVREGERKALCLTWFESEGAVPHPVDPIDALETAESFWREWNDKTAYEGIAEQAVRRSLLTLKALVHERTGGMVAAATTSLPERPGGTRNWDYRYCWLRDATFTLLGFLHTGHKEEAGKWIDWLRRAVAGEPIDVQPFYAIDGNRNSLEWEADWLQGFNDSQPVRFGNGAVGQVQLDIYGEVLDAICVARCHGLAEDSDDLIAALAEKLETIWREPDAGIWESRAAPEQHVYSKVMCWVAFDRAATMLGDSMPEHAQRWRDLAEEVRQQVLTHGFNEKRGAFTRAFDDDTLDGAVLRLPIVGFIDAKDERMVRTVEAIERELVTGDLVYRYATETTDDGVGGAEGAFIAVGLWLADVYAQQGRRDDALRLFHGALDSANDVGLLSEECWIEDGRQIGNIPQALSHVALVNTALSISADGRPPRLA